MTRKAIPALMIATGLAACAPTLQSHGYAPPDSELDDIVVGQSTKQTVGGALGRPSDLGVLEDDAWYYVSSTTSTYLYEAPELVERRVVAVQFDENDVVRDVTVYGLQDGRAVPLVTRVTETFGDELTVIDQILGGLFNPAGLVGN